MVVVVSEMILFPSTLGSGPRLNCMFASRFDSWNPRTLCFGRPLVFGNDRVRRVEGSGRLHVTDTLCGERSRGGVSGVSGVDPNATFAPDLLHGKILLDRGAEPSRG